LNDFAIGEILNVLHEDMTEALRVGEEVDGPPS